MEQDWFSYDRHKPEIVIKVPGKNILRVGIHDCEVSHYSGGHGGQNLNRHMNGVRLIYKIPEGYVQPFIKTRELIARSRHQRSQEQNQKEAFHTLAEKLWQYFYVPAPRKKTRVPKASKKRRMEQKKHHGHIKADRKRVDF
ncbi:MAG: hypothetical protein OEY44_04115 [Candidatus Peregrinibacteria bacterium]|nr:hypothetical protein [Candidatus Peregrinibacteria bacterium]